MCAKLLSADLNSSSYLLRPTNTYRSYSKIGRNFKQPNTTYVTK